MKKKTKIKRKIEKEARASRGTGMKRFAVTYLVLMGTFFFLMSFAPVKKIVDLNGLYTRGVVAATAKFLGMMSISCTHQGSLIQLPAISLDVKFGCNGLEAVMIYSVAVVAFPSTWRKKLVGIVVGFVIIQAINFLRIVALAYSGTHFRSLFEYIHLYVAQGMMIAVSLGIFFIYLSSFNYAGKEKTAVR
jgi:exosortase H (IPTLxxWG-CTERM-specific)